MRTFLLVESEFCVQKTTKKISHRQPLQKLFTNQSELEDLPTGCSWSIHVISGNVVKTVAGDRKAKTTDSPLHLAHLTQCGW